MHGIHRSSAPCTYRVMFACWFMSWVCHSKNMFLQWKHLAFIMGCGIIYNFLLVHIVDPKSRVTVINAAIISAPAPAEVANYKKPFSSMNFLTAYICIRILYQYSTLAKTTSLQWNNCMCTLWPYSQYSLDLCVFPILVKKLFEFLTACQLIKRLFCVIPKMIGFYFAQTG